VREVIEELARVDDVKAVVPASVDASVTVYARDVDWDRMLVAVLDAAGLGYRYEHSTRRLRIAPRSEIDAQLERSPRYGILAGPCPPGQAHQARWREGGGARRRRTSPTGGKAPHRDHHDQR
jgi:hypothetical protein